MAVPYRDTCGKALADIPGALLAADQLCEAIGHPARSIRTLSQLGAALMQSEKAIESLKQMLASPEKRNPKEVAHAARFLVAYGQGIKVLTQALAATILSKVKDTGDMASKQTIRLLSELSQGQHDVSPEQWGRLVQLLTHGRSQTDAPGRD